MNTLNYFWELYKKDLKTNVREISYKRYTESINYSFKKVPWLLEKDIKNITIEDIISVKETLIKYYVPMTVFRTIVLIKKLLNLAINKGIIEKNVAEEIKVKTPKSKIVKVITADDFYKIIIKIKRIKIKNISNKEIILFLEFLFKTGMRHSEVRALRWQDINFSKNTITITHSIYCFVYGIFKLTDTKTIYSRRTIHIDKKLAEKLLEYKKERRYTKNNDFVFCTRQGFPRTTDFAKPQLKKAAKALGIDISTHGLRHSHASILLKNKVNILLISRRLGHSSIKVTLDLYCHLIEEDEKDIIDLMEKIEI